MGNSMPDNVLEGFLRYTVNALFDIRGKFGKGLGHIPVKLQAGAGGGGLGQVAQSQGEAQIVKRRSSQGL